MNAARKAQDKDRTLVLGTILANLRNREIDLRRPATDEETVEVLRKGIKIRREAVEQYTTAGRTDLAAVEQAQIAVLEEFLPPAVDPEEIRAAVRAAIAGGAKELGKVMGQVLPKYKGRVDGKVVNQIVREELQAGGWRRRSGMHSTGSRPTTRPAPRRLCRIRCRRRRWRRSSWRRWSSEWRRWPRARPGPSGWVGGGATTDLPREARS